MKRLLTITMAIITILVCSLSIVGCGSSDDCFICGGSGYYQKKDCPGC